MYVFLGNHNQVVETEKGSQLCVSAVSRIQPAWYIIGNNSIVTESQGNKLTLVLSSWKFLPAAAAS